MLLTFQVLVLSKCMDAVFDIIKKGPEGRTPKDLEIIKYFIENTTDINIQDSNGRTLLALCSGYYYNESKSYPDIEIAKLLIDNNANVNIQDHYGMTALICASMWTNDNDIEFAKLLLSCVKNNTDVNIQNKYGCTAITNTFQFIADKTCSLKMSRLLLEYDAKPHDTQDINILANNIAKLNVLS